MEGRISLWRLLVVTCAAVGVVASAVVVVGSTLDRINARNAARATFAPYVDATLLPTFAFEDPITSPAREVVLGFVVAATEATGGTRCAPSWGTYYDLDGAGRALDLDRRVARLRERGGDVMVSFGGAFNSELAVVCDDVDELAAAYRSVIDRYQLVKIDLDIEGPALSDAAASRRRGEAIARLQSDATGAGRRLAVWVTLPVGADGLTAEGQQLVEGLLDAGVDIAGVNGMTMNYNGGESLRAATERSLLAMAAQFDTALRGRGVVLTPQALWRRVGATPMIGQNDTPAETWSLSDADWLVGRAGEWGIGRVSMWSANRDADCGAVVADKRVSNTCSGVEQDPLAFTWRFLRLDRAGGDTAPPVVAREPRAEQSRDDPALAPYPIWRATKQYEKGDKVVWQHDVYEAKWWTENNLPNAPVANAWESPWRYVGPVLLSDAPPTTLAGANAVVAGHPVWSPDKVYVAGDVVRWQGNAYRAKWWTQDEEPQADPDRPGDSPWLSLGPVADPVVGAGVRPAVVPDVAD